MKLSKLMEGLQVGRAQVMVVSDTDDWPANPFAAIDQTELENIEIEAFQTMPGNNYMVTSAQIEKLYPDRKNVKIKIERLFVR